MGSDCTSSWSLLTFYVHYPRLGKSGHLYFRFVVMSYFVLKGFPPTLGVWDVILIVALIVFGLSSPTTIDKNLQIDILQFIRMYS